MHVRRLTAYRNMCEFSQATPATQCPFAFRWLSRLSCVSRPPFNLKKDPAVTAWIFQCNPDSYDIDGLLASETKEILFAANQNVGRMALGDIVYIWRSQGKQKAVAGIVAKGRLLDSPRERADDGSGREFWIDPTKAKLRQRRVGLRIEEIANKKEVIQRTWMLNDPILQELKILKYPRGSNFVVEGDQLRRIKELWENTGGSWSRAQSLAALRVYHQTYGGSLSLLPDAPISQTATLIGRAMKAVYNKVLNFRHIDPRDERAGFSGAGSVDREVWDEFYNSETGEIDAEALEVEFKRLWAGAAPEEARVQVGTDVTRTTAYRPGPTPQANDYTVSAGQHDEWFVYVLELSNKKAVKVGMSHDPKVRLKQYNHTIMPEITGLSWKLYFTHRIRDAETAKEVEQAVLRRFAEHQLQSNWEILQNVKAETVQLAIISASRSTD